MEQDLVGRTLGSYRVVATIGAGGMGAVYRAEHTTIGKRVAIKVLLRHVGASPEMVRRFFNEARAAARIEHPSIIEIFDAGEDPEVGSYLVMELLSGEPLSRRLARERPLPPQVAAQLIQRVASPLQAAHEAGIVHRDLKPDNVFLIPDPDHPGEERVKLLDFGIAKLAEHHAEGQPATQTGMLMGTPHYMSPEQCHGAKNVDHRTDVYALGVLAYEALCGQVPFTGSGHGEVIAKHLYEPPPAPRALNPQLTEAVERVLLRALAKQPAERHARIDELGSALARATGVPSIAPVARDPVALAETLPPQGGISRMSAASAALAETLEPGVEVAGARAAVPPTKAAVPPTRAAPVPAAPVQATPAHKKMSLIYIIVAVTGVLALGAGTWWLYPRLRRPAPPEPVTTQVAPPSPDATTKAVRPDAAQDPRARCAGGVLPACEEQAKALWKTKEVGARQEARELMKRACDGGRGPACVWLGTTHARIDGKPALAADAFRKACEAGHPPGCFNYGLMLHRGDGIKRDPGRARQLIKSACAGGFAAACEALEGQGR